MHRDDFPQNLSFLALSKKVFYAEMDKIGARHNVTKAKKKYNGRLFSESETHFIFEYFKEFIKNRITPRKDQILAFFINSQMQDKSWTWHDIKTKIATKIYNEKKKEKILERRNEQQLLSLKSQNLDSVFNEIDKHIPNSLTKKEINEKFVNIVVFNKKERRYSLFDKCETQLIYQYFEHFIDNAIIPRKHEIESFMNKYPMKNIVTWVEIKNKVKGKINRKKPKRKETKEQKMLIKLRLKEIQDLEISKIRSKLECK